MYPRVYPKDPILGFLGGFKPELRWALKKKILKKCGDIIDVLKK